MDVAGQTDLILTRDIDVCHKHNMNVLLTQWEPLPPWNPELEDLKDALV